MVKEYFGSFVSISKIIPPEKLAEICMKNAPCGIAVFDREMRYLAASHRFLDTWGMTEQDVLGKSHYEVFPSIPRKWREVHERCLKGASESADADEFVRSPGRVEYTRWSIDPWYEETGKIGGIVLYTNVVTATVEAQRRLAGTLDGLRTILTGVSSILVTSRVGIDGSQQIVQLESGVPSFAGYTTAELRAIGAFPDSTMLYPGDLESVSRQLAARILEGRGVLEYRLFSKNGDLVWVRDIARSELLPDGERNIVSFIRDITTEKQQAVRLERAHRLLSLGQMVSGIGHELAQPLFAATLASHNALRFLNRSEPDLAAAIEKLTTMQELLERAGDIVENMRTLAKGNIPASVPTALDQLVSDATTVVQHRLTRHAVTLLADVPPGLSLVEVPTQLYLNIVVNLIGNAIDQYIMDDVPEPRVVELVATASDGGRVSLTVRDQAGGIPDAVLPHIFEPFYTTKSPDRGTGLGLAISYAVIRDTGGELHVENKRGGAAFTIVFPPSGGR